MRNVPSARISPAAFDRSATDSRETVPPASSRVGEPSSNCTTPSTGYSRFAAQPARARARATATSSFSARLASIASLPGRDDLPVIPLDQQADRRLGDGHRQRADAAVAEDELADPRVPAAEPLVGGRAQVGDDALARAADPGEDVGGVAVPDRPVALDLAELAELDVLLADEDGVAQPVDDVGELRPAAPLRAVADADDDRPGGAGLVVGGDGVGGVVAGGRG